MHHTLGDPLVRTHLVPMPHSALQPTHQQPNKLPFSNSFYSIGSSSLFGTDLKYEHEDSIADLHEQNHVDKQNIITDAFVHSTMRSTCKVALQRSGRTVLRSYRCTFVYSSAPRLPLFITLLTAVPACCVTHAVLLIRLSSRSEKKREVVWVTRVQMISWTV
jgi:hypothetical protein